MLPTRAKLALLWGEGLEQGQGQGQGHGHGEAVWKDMLVRVNAGMRELGAAAAVALTDVELLARGMELAV